MIIGIGNDIESISRVGQIVDQKNKFLTSILTASEIDQASTRRGKHYHEFVAGRFSAKEAFSKATGFGIGEKVKWQDIEVLNEKNGRSPPGPGAAPPGCGRWSRRWRSRWQWALPPREGRSPPSGRPDCPL